MPLTDRRRLQCRVERRLSAFRAANIKNTLGLQGDNGPAALPFESLEILEDRINVIVEARRVLLPHLADFLHDWVFHTFSFPSIVPGCKAWAIRSQGLRRILP